MNIGIDLGTTNSALAYIDSTDEADYPTIHVLDVPQYVAQGRVESRRTLPSFLYLGDQEYTGVYAREQGAIVPTKSVNSEELVVESGCGSYGEDFAVGCAGGRAGVIAGRRVDADLETFGGGLGEGEGVGDCGA